ncbi:MAG: hypothetical protein OER04_10690 [Cyclobacteriaceae bacterium]|nr:hypothetical protein [Cyclobacteriaceae bacterium]
MVTLIEKEIEQRDIEIKSLLKELALDTMDNTTSKVKRAAIEKEILHKMLKEQKLEKRNTLFAVESGLLLFAITMFGVLGAFVTFLVAGYQGASPTWDQLGSDMAVLVLLITMTALSTVLYLQHYRNKSVRR